MDDLVEKVDAAIRATMGRPHAKDDLAIAALSAIQETHAIVPIEPTEAMIEAGGKLRAFSYATSQIYKAMIEASPHYD